MLNYNVMEGAKHRDYIWKDNPILEKNINIKNNNLEKLTTL